MVDFQLDSSLIVIGLAAIVATLYALLLRRAHTRPQRLPTHPTYDELNRQMGRAIESGRRLHVGLGQAGLTEASLPATTAAQAALTKLVRDGVRGKEPPLVTVGDATALPLAQESLQAHLPVEQPLMDAQAQFVASNSTPYAYAAGSMAVIQQKDVGGNVLLGHFGAEVALMADAAERRNLEQVIGSDDPTAVAVATAYTPHVLIGERFLATQAYIENRPAYLASLQIQNLLRISVVLIIFLLGILNFLGIDLQTLIG